MACHGITVMEYERIRLAEAVSEVEEVLRRFGVKLLSKKTISGEVKMAFSLGGVQVLCSVKQTPDGAKITMISQNGTFELGQQKFEEYIVKGLASQGISINPTFETHTHGPQQAYQLAYTTAQVSR